jgi:hypothetical protein
MVGTKPIVLPSFFRSEQQFLAAGIVDKMSKEKNDELACYC